MPATGDTPPSGLRTDLYELTMMNGYLQSGLADRRVAFDLFLRRIPENGGFCVAAGLADAVRFITDVRFSPEEIDYLRGMKLFSEEFLARLRDFRFSGDLRAVAEGTLIFPFEPLLQVQAPLFEAQYFESALLNTINFQTLIATKAARVCQEAGVDNVMEFGMRRAHGPDGALSATRAAFIGGAESTSNTEAGRRLRMPVRGTHAHSWIMAFGDELQAFRAYAEIYPDTCFLLVDTYDTLRSGLPNAIRVAHELAARGYQLRGIRLDSGDLAYLSRRARRMLDEAGLPQVRIVASGDLDEWIIHDLKSQGACIDLWGVGTRLITSHQEPSATGVYKLAAIETDGKWSPRLKVAESAAKATLPGIKQIWRLTGARNWWEADLITQDDEAVAADDAQLIGYHPLVEYESKLFEDIKAVAPLLNPIITNGELIAEPPDLNVIRQHTCAQLAHLHPTSRRLLNPHIYKVSISAKTLRIRQELRAQVAPSSEA